MCDLAGALDIKAISHELEVVRAEQEDLARTTLHLREEISVLNENIVKKDLEIRQKDAAYEYLLGRNALLLEQSESNDRLVSSLRVRQNYPNMFKRVEEGCCQNVLGRTRSISAIQ